LQQGQHIHESLGSNGAAAIDATVRAQDELRRAGRAAVGKARPLKGAVIHNGMLDRDVSFLPKPFTIQQLATKIRQVLDQK
jgi:hypothetical protein